MVPGPGPPGHEARRLWSSRRVGVDGPALTVGRRAQRARPRPRPEPRSSCTCPPCRGILDCVSGISGLLLGRRGAVSQRWVSSGSAGGLFMLSAHRPRSSLARSTLTQMGVRVAVIIALATLLSYLHIFRAFREEALGQLERSVLRRGQQEQAIRSQAEGHHVVLRKAMQERLRAWQALDPRARFDSLFISFPDGTIRSRPEGFDGTSMPGVFILAGVTVDDDFRRRILAAYDVVDLYGPALHVRFTNTYILLPEAAIVIYWPEQPTWCWDVDPASMDPDFELFTVSTPRRNPQRRMTWTAITVEPIAISLATPVDLDGHHVASIGHDILIEELKARTLNDSPPGAYNLIFSNEAELIVHPGMRMKAGAFAYDILNEERPLDAIFDQALSTEERTHLRAIFERVKSRAPGQTVLELPEYDEYLAVAWLEGPDWNLVTVLPQGTVSSAAFGAARYVLVFGLASLVMELLIMFWVLRRQISHPLRAFTQATDQVTAGDFQVVFRDPRDDELGQLARGFELMAHELQRREAALREANEGLESRIEARTRELREKNLELEGALTQLEEAQELLVEKERLASLGALMAGIAHEIKNPLNFVNNFAQLSAGLVKELREELKEQPSGQGGSSLQRMDELLSWLEQNVGKIEEHGKRADSILRTMQLHSHVRASERVLTDLNALVEEQLSLISQSLRSTHPGLEVLFHKDLEPDLGWVKLAPQDFGRALLNLLDNSLYAVAEKRKQVGPGFTPEVTVSIRSEGTRVRLLIRDNGTGIPRKLHDKVFSPFFTTKPAGVGTGLGLAICHDIVVRQHRGEIRLDSVEGQYTEFLLVLPRADVKR
ncbi:HAMP domain-containing protein [Cystobacter fuscus]|nr:HAMP domain-containing protein [Cystobacter fuscus]